MPEQYSYTGSYPDVQVTGPATAVDILRISGKTIPHGVSFTINAPYRGLVGINVKGAAPTPAQALAVANRFAGPIAAGIERMMGMGIVAGASAIEDTDASGLLVDYIEATVEYVPTRLDQGSFTAAVRIPTGAFDEPSFFNALVATPINAAYATLQALAKA